MASRRTLKLVNVPRREQMELELLLSLVESRGGAHWQIVTADAADAVVVDTDQESTDDQALEQARATAACVITLGSQRCRDEDLHLQRPVRMEALAAVLHSVPAAGARDTHQPGRSAPHVAYRILRWPPRELLQADWRYTRICGALMSGPQTPEALSARLVIDPQTVRDLLANLETQGLVKVKVTTTAMPTQGGHARRSSGLFSRLRERLGLH